METIGTLELPIERVMWYTGLDENALDLLFDLNKEVTAPILTFFHSRKEKAMALIPSSTHKDVVALLLFMPYKGWIKDNVDYLVFIAPSIYHLIKHFQNRLSRVRDNEEQLETRKVLKYLQRNESTILKYHYKE
jgi:hypothetical protein